MMRVLPQSALGQIVGIVVSALLVTFGVTFAFFALFGPVIPPRPIGPGENAIAIGAVVHGLDAVLPASRPTLAAAMSARHFRVLVDPPASLCPGDPSGDPLLERSLPDILDGRPGLSIRLCAPPADDAPSFVRVQVPISGGTVAIDLDRPPVARIIGVPIVVALLFLLVVVTVLAVWAAWRITRPLRRLAQTVDAFGQNMMAATLPETGPREIRQAARAFNGMQAAIASFVQDRSLMLAAISHDLRTPLTRLKLRVQLEDKSDTQRAMLRDIGQLQTMIDAALSYLRGQSGGEERDWIDIGALVTTICDEFAEAGARIICDAGPLAPCLCQPVSIRRAIVNLVENARQHGTAIGVSVVSGSSSVTIEVSDDGPGIADDDKPRMLRPFTRLSATRATTTGHVGLGLAIVQDIVRAHGGTLALLDHHPQGLLVRFVLPTGQDDVPATKKMTAGD